MSYVMCLDNSWDVMCEEEMYDINGGVKTGKYKIWGVTTGYYAIFSNSELGTFIDMIDTGVSFYGGLVALGIAAKAAPPLAGVMLIAFAIIKTVYLTGGGYKVAFNLGAPYHYPVW